MVFCSKLIAQQQGFCLHSMTAVILASPKWSHRCCEVHLRKRASLKSPLIEKAENICLSLFFSSENTWQKTALLFLPASYYFSSRISRAILKVAVPPCCYRAVWFIVGLPSADAYWHTCTCNCSFSVPVICLCCFIATALFLHNKKICLIVKMLQNY